MKTDLPGIELRGCDAEAARPLVPSFLDLFSDVYGVAPYADDPYFSVETYDDRLQGALAMPGFQILVARDASGRVIGTAHGVTLPPTAAWWPDASHTAPPALADAANTARVFWLRELMVRERHRNKGLGRKLHDALAESRHEDYVAMTVIVNNEPARSAYLRWGYQIFALIRHAPDSPLYDAMYRHRPRPRPESGRPVCT